MIEALVYGYDGGWPVNQTIFQWVIPLIIMELILKGFALWRSAINRQKIWFIAILFLNTLGILPAFYLLTNPQKD